MKSISIIKTFDGYEYVKEVTKFDSAEWIANNNYITRLQLTENINSYVIGANVNGSNRITPLTYITSDFYTNESFEFVKDDDTVITISYENFEKVYRKAEETLQEQYILATQGKIGIDYLINTYENGEWE